MYWNLTAVQYRGGAIPPPVILVGSFSEYTRRGQSQWICRRASVQARHTVHSGVTQSLWRTGRRMGLMCYCRPGVLAPRTGDPCYVSSLPTLLPPNRFPFSTPICTTRDCGVRRGRVRFDVGSWAAQSSSTLSFPLSSVCGAASSGSAVVAALAEQVVAATQRRLV